MSYDHVEDDDEQSMICNVCPTTCAFEAYAFEPTVSETGANMSQDETESKSEESDDSNDSKRDTFEREELCYAMSSIKTMLPLPSTLRAA